MNSKFFKVTIIPGSGWRLLCWSVRCGLVLLSAVPILLAFAAAVSPLRAPAQPLPGHYIAVFKSNLADPEATARGLGGQLGLNVQHVYRHSIRGFAFGGSAQAAETLARNPLIAYVEPDQMAYTTAVEDSLPTGVRRIGINAAVLEQISPSGQGVNARIAIIDTGLDRYHPDLNIDPNGVRFFMKATQVKRQYVYEIVSDDQWDDYHGHGTHVGGTAAAKGAIMGVAPGAQVTAVNVLGSSGSAPTSVVIAGVDWVAARADRFDVANMSLGGGFSQASNDAVRRATELGIVFVVAAGNEGLDASLKSPASEPTAITVSAMGDFDGIPGASSTETWTSSNAACQDGVTGEPILMRDDALACFSNRGGSVDVCAPGVRILSTSTNGTYKTMSGTSMAAPHVAGAVAVYIAQNREAISGLTGSARVTHISQAVTSRAWAFNDYGYFSGDTDGIPEPLLNIQALLGAERPAFIVSINSPVSESRFEPGETISFSAAATVNGENWTDAIVWTSSIDGLLGNQAGGTFSAVLSEGTHTITASVTDSVTSFSGWDAIVVTVGDGTVQPPPPPGPVQLFVAVSTDKSEYVNNETMRGSFMVTDKENGPPVQGATVAVTMTDAKGAQWTTSGTTDATGLFLVTWKVSSARGGRGTYTLSGNASKTGCLPGNGSTTFVVK